MPETRRVGIVGWPLGYSLSPAIHQYWLDRLETAGSYDSLPLKPENFEDDLARLQSQGYCGFNITVPFKERVCPLLDRLTAQARRCGAANTIWQDRDGAWQGDNTDGAGFRAALKQNRPDWQPGTGRVVIVGAGGAARGILAVLKDAGQKDFALFNRTPERTARLEADFDLIDCMTGGLKDIDDVLNGDVSLLVNASTMGMKDENPFTPDLEQLPEDCPVFDAVYAPLETALLRRARRRHLPVIDGLSMLMHQAAPAFARFFGHTPTVDQGLRDHILGLMQDA